MGLANKGRKWSPEVIEKRRQGVIRAYFEHPEIREFLSQNQRGARHWNWKGGKTPELHKLRQTDEYNEWRQAVYARDHWTCRSCGFKGKGIVAHHILPFKDYPMVRFSVENGVTLCRACHKRIHAEVGAATRFKPKPVEARP